MKLLLLIIACLAPACQTTKTKATRSVDRMESHAVAATKDVATAQTNLGALVPHVADEGAPMLKDAQNALVGAQAHLSGIVDEAVNVAKPNIEKLRNPDSWLKTVWGNVKTFVLWVALLYFVYLISNAGSIPFLGPIISWVWSKVSFSTRLTSEAQLAVKTEHDPAARELIAAKRASRADFNGSYIREKARQAKKAGG